MLLRSMCVLMGGHGNGCFTSNMWGCLYLGELVPLCRLMRGVCEGCIQLVFLS
jgi:hypothetical protein